MDEDRFARSLPLELFDIICSFLQFPSHSKMRQVCGSWNALICDKWSRMSFIYLEKTEIIIGMALSLRSKLSYLAVGDLDLWCGYDFDVEDKDDNQASESNANFKCEWSPIGNTNCFSHFLIGPYNRGPTPSPIEATRIHFSQKKGELAETPLLNFVDFLCNIPTYRSKTMKARSTPHLNISFPEIHCSAQADSCLFFLSHLTGWDVELSFNSHSTNLKTIRMIPFIPDLVKFIYYNNTGALVQFSGTQVKLKSLSINSCYRQSDSEIQQLVRNSPNLVELQIHIRDILGVPIELIPNRLTHLSLEAIVTPSFFETGIPLPHLQMLALFLISDNDGSRNLSENALKHICNLPQLKSLNLHQTLLLNHQNLSMLSSATNLTGLGLTDTKLNKEGLKTIPFLPNLASFEWTEEGVPADALPDFLRNLLAPDTVAVWHGI